MNTIIKNNKTHIKILMENLLRTLDEKNINCKAHNMGTDQSVFLKNLTTDFAYGQIKAIKTQPLDICKKEPYAQLYLILENGDEINWNKLTTNYKITNSASSGALHQKLDILQSAGLIDKYYSSNRKKELQTNEIIIPFKYNSISSNEWNSADIIFKLIQNEVQNLDKLNISIGLSYLLSFFFIFIPEEFAAEIDINSQIIKKVTLRSGNKENYKNMKLLYLYTFLNDGKNNFKKQWKLFINDIGFENIINKIHQIIQNFNGQQIDLISENDYIANKISAIIKDVDSNLRKHQVKWKETLKTIRKFQGRTKDDCDIEDIDSSAVHGAHIFEAAKIKKNNSRVSKR